MFIQVALCQIEVVPSDREGNLGRIAAAVAEAKRAGADLAVFPESCVLGWVNPEAHRLAHSIPGGDSVWLCRLAKQNEIDLIVGLGELDQGALYGSVVAISSQGALLAKHRKRNVLSELMDPPYASGTSSDVQVAVFSWGKVALLICADTFEDDLIEQVRVKGADLLAVPYGWAAEPSEWPRHAEKLRDLVLRRSNELKIPVIGVDCVGEISAGPWRGRTFGGASVAAGDGKILNTNLKIGRPGIGISVVSLPRRPE